MNDWPGPQEPGRGGRPRGQVPPGRSGDVPPGGPRRQPPPRREPRPDVTRDMNQRRQLPVRNPYPRNPQAARSQQDANPDARAGRPGGRPPRGPDGPRPRGAGAGGAAAAASRTKWMRAGKVVTALASVIVVIALGFSWAQANGITTANVIDPSAQDPTGEQNILLVGLDNRTDAQGNPLPQSLLDQLHAGDTSDGGDNTDTMIVIHVPAGGGKATAFSIPRDSYVQLAGDYGMHKINSAYTYAEVAAQKSLRGQGVSGPQLAVQADAAGAQNAIHTVQNFTGLTINHFASVNLAGFYSISQAIGGVQVCLKAPVHDSYSGADFPAGLQTIQGAQALAFVRQRHGLPLGDLDRIRRQQAFMASMAHTVLGSGVLTDPSKLNALINAIKGAVTIDQGWDIFSFAQQMANMSSGNLQFDTIPIVNETYPTPSDGDAVEVNPQQVQQFISSTINAQNATPSTNSTPSSKSNPASNNSAANAAVTAEVLNGSGKTGLASKVMSVLTGQGFTSGGTGNTSARSSSVVEYGSGGQSAAQQVASALGGLSTESDSALPTGHVRVLIGTAYNGPTSGSGSSSSTSTSTGGQTTSSGPSGATPAIVANGVTCVD